MNRFKTAGFALVLLAWTFSLPSSAAISDKPEGVFLPQPSADLAPQDVVRIVINALSNNDEPYADAGIKTTFSFASPANKVNTGPLERFIQMVKGPPYGVMVDHVGSVFSGVVLMDNKAYQMVQLTAPDGRAEVFAFRLSKQQDGEFKDMCMTDAVWPVATAAVPEQAF